MMRTTDPHEQLHVMLETIEKDARFHEIPGEAKDIYLPRHVDIWVLLTNRSKSYFHSRYMSLHHPIYRMGIDHAVL